MSRGLAMGGHQSAAMISDTWLTPPVYAELVGTALMVHLDTDLTDMEVPA